MLPREAAGSPERLKIARSLKIGLGGFKHCRHRPGDGLQCPSDPDIAPYGGGTWVAQICAEQLFHSPDESPRTPRALTVKATRGWLVALVRPHPHLLPVALTLPVAAPRL